MEDFEGRAENSIIRDTRHEIIRMWSGLNYLRIKQPLLLVVLTLCILSSGG